MSRSARDPLKSYELTNLFVLVLGLLVLGVVVTLVFRSYGSRDSGSEGLSENPGIVSEDLVPGSDSCIFQVGTTMFTTSRRIQDRTEIPVTDDGLIRELMGIRGIVGLSVSPRTIVLTKSPTAIWVQLQPYAKEVIEKHLHMHQ